MINFTILLAMGRPTAYCSFGLRPKTVYSDPLKKQITLRTTNAFNEHRYAYVSSVKLLEHIAGGASPQPPPQGPPTSIFLPIDSA